MAERISKQPVVDRDDYPHRIIYIDSEGYVCMADKPKGLSLAEKKERQEARDEAREEKIDERAAAREALRKAKKKAKKEISVENTKAYEEALAKYEELMGRD